MRVHDAARLLGFEVNRVARSLRTRSSMLVGVVVPDVAIDFYARALKGAQSVLEQAGYQVLVMNSEREARREGAALRTLLAHQVDGILIATSGGLRQPVRIPVVFFDHVIPGAGDGCVSLSNAEGIDLLVAHLREHGHARIAYVGAPPRMGIGSERRKGSSAVERLEGFRAAMAGAGLTVRPEYVRLGDDAWSTASGESAARALLELPDPPTAVVAASDTLAIGVLQACRAGGRRVPEEVALVSFDDPVFGELLDPPVTALSRHDRELGELAASLLVRRLQGDGGDSRSEVRVPLRLIVRRSCGCGMHWTA